MKRVTWRYVNIISPPKHLGKSLRTIN